MAEIEGYCHSRFSRVRDEFERNFRGRGDIGASVCVTLDGETVVDLWGGIADPDTGRPWGRDTVCMVWSCTKGATALCAHILSDRGLLDLNAPVVRYWPEFGQKGKDRVTVKMLLSHQAGLPTIRRLQPHGAFYDWETMVRLLENEELFWEPGTTLGYHPYTFGWLVGEVVRRVSGKSVGTFFRDEVAQPLGLDLWIGLPEDIEPRVAPTLPPDPVVPSPEVEAAEWYRIMMDPHGLQMALTNTLSDYATEINTRAFRAAEMPALNGITNARGLAGMYAPLACGGSLNGVRLVGPNALARMAAVTAAVERSASGGVPSRFSLGYIKPTDCRHLPGGEQLSDIFAEEAFGHSGLGGSEGLADPRAHMSFGYVMNKRNVTPRAQSLIDATYLSLGYTSNVSGVWI